MKTKKPVLLGVLLGLLGLALIGLAIHAIHGGKSAYLSLGFGLVVFAPSYFIAKGKIIGAYIYLVCPAYAFIWTLVESSGDIKQVAAKTFIWFLLAIYIFSPLVRPKLS